MTSFNTGAGPDSYFLHFETDDKEKYLYMQEQARKCIDNAYTKMTEAEKSFVLKGLSDIIFDFVDGIMKTRHCSANDMVFLNGLQALADYMEKRS